MSTKTWVVKINGNEEIEIETPDYESPEYVEQYVRQQLGFCDDSVEILPS